jgi:metal-dependent amidase/aminoacylase/carboxypeptidase family protein
VIAGTDVATLLKGVMPGPKLLVHADMEGLSVAEETGLPFTCTTTLTIACNRSG